MRKTYDLVHVNYSKFKTVRITNVNTIYCFKIIFHFVKYSTYLYNFIKNKLNNQKCI